MRGQPYFNIHKRKGRGEICTKLQLVDQTMLWDPYVICKARSIHFLFTVKNKSKAEVLWIEMFEKQQFLIVALSCSFVWSLNSIFFCKWIANLQLKCTRSFETRFSPLRLKFQLDLLVKRKLGKRNKTKKITYNQLHVKNLITCLIMKYRNKGLDLNIF